MLATPSMKIRFATRSFVILRRPKVGLRPSFVQLDSRTPDSQASSAPAPRRIDGALLLKESERLKSQNSKTKPIFAKGKCRPPTPNPKRHPPQPNDEPRTTNASRAAVQSKLRYLPKSDSERREMLDAIGARSLEDLFAYLPPEVRFNRPLAIAPGKSEYDIVDYFRARGTENANGYASFLGAGVYNHYRPVLVDTVVSRGEFLTSYT